jgi:branched-chain amino acid transport system substrate-binding protein
VIAVDDRANAETGKEVAKQLVDAGVVAVIGHLNSGVSIAAAPIYAEKHIAQLAISTNPNPKFTQLGFDTTFRLVANDVLQAKAIGSFSASQFPATKYALLDDGTPYGKDLAAGAAVQLKSAAKEIVVQQSTDEKSTKFDEFAAKIKAGGVEVVVTTVSDFQVLALLEALKAINYTQVNVLGADTIKTTDMLKGSDVVAAAMRRGESAQPETLVETLRKIDGYAPVTGSMKWDAKGEQRYGVIGVYSGRNGAWESQVRSDSW